MLFFILIILTTIVYSAGAYFSKLYANSLNNHIQLAILVFILYSIVTIIWLYILRSRNQLTIMGLLFATLCALSEITIGIIIFNEPLTNYSKVGIFFGFISIIFLSL